MAHSLAQNLFGIKRVSERSLVSSLQRDGRSFGVLLHYILTRLIMLF